jgi:hypothetical protein
VDLIVSETELWSLVCSELGLSEKEERTFEALGCALEVYANPDYKLAISPRYWENLKEEFRILICTKDKKYASLRRELNAKAHRSQTVIVSMISATMTSTLGISAGILVPFCALCLLALARIGKEAFCKGGELDASIRPPQDSSLPPP